LVDFSGKTDVLHSIYRQAGTDYWQLPGLFNATTEQHGQLITALEADAALKANPYRGMILQNLHAMKEGRLAKFVASKKRSASVLPIFKPSGIVNPDRAKVVEQFRPALAKRGKAELGRKIFEQRCGACHQLGGVGQAIGPDLRASRSNGAEQMLIHLIDPNREVAAQYVLHEVRTAKGRETIVGSIRFMNDAVIQVGLPDGSERQLLRSDGDEVKSIGRSLMPEGLEAGLSVVQMADLLAWLLEAE
jgi:putative heme-binding domain-containing protein